MPFYIPKQQKNQGVSLVAREGWQVCVRERYGMLLRVRERLMTSKLTQVPCFATLLSLGDTDTVP